jgi:hypothetical protein
MSSPASAPPAETNSASATKPAGAPAPGAKPGATPAPGTKKKPGSEGACGAGSCAAKK